MIHVEKILYPTDFSSYSNQAYFHAVGLAKLHKASLTVAYVFDPEKAVTPNSTGDRDADRTYWRRQLEQIHPLDESIPVRHVMLDGDPATELVRLAREQRFSLVVMGTHGRTGLERALMGSVAEKVLREAPCSVLVVKLPKAG
jgi:nucleotide-binding universal stress UspA family protein